LIQVVLLSSSRLQVDLMSLHLGHNLVE